MSFYVGQIIEDKGLKFEITDIDPITLKCLGVEKWRGNPYWHLYFTQFKIENLYNLIPSIGGGYIFDQKDFDASVPWIVVYIDGKIDSIQFKII